MWRKGERGGSGPQPFCVSQSVSLVSDAGFLTSGLQVIGGLEETLACIVSPCLCQAPLITYE